MLYYHGMVHIWVNARDFCTYRIDEQRRLWRVCAYAYAQTHQSLRCSHTQSMDVDEGSDQSLDIQLHCTRQHGRFCRGTYAYAIGTNIGLYICESHD